MGLYLSFSKALSSYNRNYMFSIYSIFIFISILNRHANKRNMNVTLHDTAVAVKIMSQHTLSIKVLIRFLIQYIGTDIMQTV